VYFNILVISLLERFNPAYCTCTGHLHARKMIRTANQHLFQQMKQFTSKSQPGF